MAELGKLIEELESWRTVLTRPPGGWPDQQFASAYPGLLLVHRLGRPLEDPDAIQTSGKLTLYRANEKSARQEIGTDRCVFCSVGSAPYWDPPVVLLFGPLELFVADRLVTPWDSRGAAKRAGQLGPDLVARYSLRWTDDRDYLPRHLATCFPGLLSFLQGQPPAQVDPAQVFLPPANARRADVALPIWLTTPEARFEADISVDGSALRAVFVDVEALVDDARKRSAAVLRRLVERGGGEYRPLKRGMGAVDYQGEVASFMTEWLTNGGWL